MAKLYPDIKKSRVVFASSAEERFYATCMQQLDDSWHVYYSVTLSTIDNAGMADNEADFVLYHADYGVIVIEIKGGRIRYDASTDRFFTINRHDESFAIKNPFQQALVWKSRFIRFAKKNGMRVPVSHCVCFPSVNEQEIPTSAGIEPEIIIGNQKLNELESALTALVKKTQPAKFLDFKDAGTQLQTLLKSDSFSTKLHIRDYIDGHEKRLKDLETLHNTFVRPIVSSQRLGVEGEAGTGKTLLASLICKHFRDEGKKVLFLSTNQLLNNIVRRDFAQDVSFDTYSGVADKFGINLMIPPADYEGSSSDWMQIEGPSRLISAMKNNQDRYDVLICDEAQDVQPFWWECFEQLLKDPEQSRFYIFFDRGQGVFGSGDEETFIPEEVLPVAAPYFPLVHNYRTTLEIASFSRHFRTGKNIIQSHSERLGYIPKIITYKDEEDAQKKINELVHNMVMVEGIKPEECTLLSARRADADSSIIKGLKSVGGIPLHHVSHQKGHKTPHKKGHVGASTIAMFKGLETSIGIIINLSEYNLPADHPIMSSLIYVACTRAKHMLYVFTKEGDSKHQAFENALEGIESKGGVTVQDYRSDYSYMGRITHYNPDRVGVLTVADPTFEKGRIMFFPHDVKKAGLENVKTGMKVRFRPVQEGDHLIASDLQLAE